MKDSIIVLIGAAVAALLFMSGRKGGEGGTGGSLDIPALWGTGSIGGDPVTSQLQQQPLIQQLFPNLSNPVTVNPNSYNNSTWAGQMNPVNPIAASREAVYNPFASILSIPNAGTAAPGSPYGLGVSPLSNPASTEKKSSVSTAAITQALFPASVANPVKSSTSSGGSSGSTGTRTGSSGSVSSPSKKASVAAPSKSLSSYSGYSPRSWR